MQMDRNTSTEGKDTELFEEITEFSSFKICNALCISTL